ncbi:MAG: Lrp/AsnC family transcriptional regulator [Actinobacteria bacterium]|nr:MAG: Lrp/AsnC family transcriptional regulator [Actinomycetota bacterium]
MAVKAYVLVQTEVGKAARVCAQVARLERVISAADVTGPYDVIVRVEADSMHDLGKMVVSRLQLTDGVTRTLTCPIVELGRAGAPERREHVLG